jgi:hypothetical protein
MNLPYTTTPLEVRLLWHERVEEEPSHEWLHDVLRRATDELRRGTRGRSHGFQLPNRCG